MHGLKWPKILRFSLCPGVYNSEILILISRFDVVSCFGLSSLFSLCFLRLEKRSTNGSVLQDFRTRNNLWLGQDALLFVTCF